MPRSGGLKVETRRRRRWSEDEKLKVVLESLQAPRQVLADGQPTGHDLRVHRPRAGQVEAFANGRNGASDVPEALAPLIAKPASTFARRAGGCMRSDAIGCRQARSAMHSRATPARCMIAPGANEPVVVSDCGWAQDLILISQRR